MAITVVRGKQNVVGNRREETLTITPTDPATVGTFETHLNYVTFATADSKEAQGSTTIYKNSKTASTTEDDPGHVYIASMTADDIHTLIATGK